MEFRETLLAAQRNQQQKSSENVYYKARFDPPKKEQKSRDKLSTNIQKFLAKKEEEEKLKKLETLKKRDELLAMRDPKAMRKIQKSLKVFKSANKSVLDDAIDRDHTAVTREGVLPDQDDYGYESQEAAAIYQKMMDKYSKVPDEPKFPSSAGKTKKDLDSTKERVKQALLHVDDPVPHKRRRRTGGGEEGAGREASPPPAAEPEKKAEKPKVRRPAPPPMDFNQLLKLAEQKKADPLEVAAKKVTSEPEPERLMTKKQRREHEEELARRMRRQERLDAEKGGAKKVQQKEQPKEERPPERERTQPSSFGRIPKIGERNSAAAARVDSPKTARNDSPKTIRNDSPKYSNRTDRDREKPSERDREKAVERERQQKQKERPKVDKDKADKEKQDRDRLEKLKAERERIERDIERLNKDRERLEKTKQKLESNTKSSAERPKLGKEQEVKKNIDLKSQNTYRIDKNTSGQKPYPNKSGSSMNGHSSQGKPVPKPQSKDRPNGARPENDRRPEPSKHIPSKGRYDQKPLQKSQAPPAKPKIEAFDFDKAVGSLKNGQGSGMKKPNGATRDAADKRKQMMKRRRMESDSEYDSEMDDFIDDRDEDLDYSKHIKEIFGYDKSKYRDIDDGDDRNMESSFSRVMHEEYVSKKIGIMEDLEDIRLEKKMNKMKKKRCISDD